MAYKNYFDDATGGTPVLVSDEPVNCTTSVSAFSGTYYEGWIVGSPSNSVEGSTSSTEGAYTATSKGGTRYTVTLSNAPGALEVLVDLKTGRCLTSASVTLYFHYNDYGRKFKHWEIGPEVRLKFEEAANNSGANYKIYTELVRAKTRLVAAQVTSPLIAAAGNVTFTLENNDTSTTDTFTLTSASRSEITEFSSGIVFDKGETLNIYVGTNTSNIHKYSLILYTG